MKKLFNILLLLTVFIFGSGCADKNSSETLDRVSYISEYDYLIVGTELQLKVMGYYSDGSSENLSSALIWSSSDETLSTVNSGLVTALKEGFVTISYHSVDTLPSGEYLYSGDILFEVKNGVLESIQIIDGNISIYTQQQRQLTAKAKYVGIDDLYMIDCNWTSSDAGVATVSSSGLLTGVVAGSVNITALDVNSTLSDTVKVEVLQNSYVSLSVSSPEGTTFNVGESMLLKAEGTNKTGDVHVVTEKVTWASKDESIVSMVDENATAKAIGDVNITASLDGVVGTIELNVDKDEYLTLYNVTDDANDKLKLPYLCFSNTLCKKEIDVDNTNVYTAVESFKLVAYGADFTIKNLRATDFSDVNQSGIKFNGLAENQTILEGNEVTFYLEYTKNDNNDKELKYSFKVNDETDFSFVATYLLK